MKNRYQEYFIERQKTDHRGSARYGVWKRGLKVFHRYPAPTAPQHALSWWDDCEFIMGSRRVAVVWRHPRYEYEGRAIELAHEAPSPDGKAAVRVEELLRDSAISIEPYLQRSNRRGYLEVFLHIPEEVRNETELRGLAEIVKKLLRRETTLAELYPEYRYTCADWIREDGSRAQDNEIKAARGLLSVF